MLLERNCDQIPADKLKNTLVGRPFIISIHASIDTAASSDFEQVSDMPHNSYTLKVTHVKTFPLPYGSCRDTESIVTL